MFEAVEKATEAGSTVDLLPENWSDLSWNFQLMILCAGRGGFHEEVEGHCHVNRLGPSGSSWQVVQAATTSCHSANAAALNAFKVGREIR